MTKKALLLLPWVVLLCAFSLFAQTAQRQIEIYNLRSHTHPSFTRIVVDIGQLREYNFNKLTDPDRIYVDIHQVKLNAILHGKKEAVDNGYVKQIRIAQKNLYTVRIAVDLDLAKTKNYHVWHLFDPFRIVIDIYPLEPSSESVREKTAQAARPTKSGYSMARQLGLGIKKIVIDPGHGGRDPGTLSKKGAKEKDIVLDVSIRLKELIDANTQLEVILTRESDIYIPVENRTVIANQQNADLFISIHANSNPSRKHSGAQTFYLNFSRDASVMATAALENATSTKKISEMTDIIRKITRNSKIAESKEMAEIIQANMVKHLHQDYKNLRDLGVKGGPFWVLIGGDMPSILIEISHMSNQQEAARLATPEYRQMIARGIYVGILQYINSLGKG